MNVALRQHVVLPLILLTAALLGGLRFALPDLEMRFVAPPLTTLLLGSLLVVLYARSGLLNISRDWLGVERTTLENASNGLTLAALFIATIQIFNAVLPEDTLFFSLFAVGFGLVFWNNLFVPVRPDRLVKSLAGLLLAAFVAKYVFLASLFAPGDSITRSVLQSLVRGVTLGTVQGVAYAPATGYTAFLGFALYLCGLWLASPPRDPDADRLYDLLASADRLSQRERARLLAAIPGETVDAALVESDEEHST